MLYEHYTDPSGYDEPRSTAAFQRLVLDDAVPHLASQTVGPESARNRDDVVIFDRILGRKPRHLWPG
ncbi:MAG: hypothetical protein PHQ28_08125 [Mycobacterium sp.]|nr:hypothetical protein [Mycobacterium sp.]